MRRTWGKVILLMAVAGILAFIWSRSMCSKEESAAQSDGILAWADPFLRSVFGPEADTEKIVRKTAHFAEFGALGAAAALIPVLWEQKHLMPRLVCAFGVMAAALADETIQIFFSRGSEVPDVWIDFAGGVCGIAVMTALVFPAKRGKRRK